MEPFFFLSKDVDINLNDFLFIMPVVAAGNVGQLAIDLLISTLKVELYGRFHHYSITPIVGGDPYQSDSNILTTACQIYICHDKKIVILQQRSPVLPTCRNKFVSLLADWVKERGFKATITLSSAFNHFQTENDKIHKIQYLTSDVKPKEGPIDSEKLSNLKEINKLDGSKENLDLPGSGITELLYKKLKELKQPVLILACFCSEGDNTPDALLLVEHLNQIKPILNMEEKNRWKWPISWNCLFGNEAPKSIY